MSDSFFQKKRKRTGAETKAGPSTRRMRDKASGKRAADEDELDGGFSNDDDDDAIDNLDLTHKYDDDIQESDEDNAETPAEARVRLAQLYLESLKDDELDPQDADAAEVDRQNISSRLQQDSAAYTSHVHHFVAERLGKPPASQVVACRGHRLSVTATAIAADFASFWTASKDGTIIRWRLRDGKQLEKIAKIPDKEPSSRLSTMSKTSGAARRRARGQVTYSASNSEKLPQQIHPSQNEGHSDEVWALTTSSDGKHLVSGGKDRRICVWSLASGGVDQNTQTQFVKALGGHKDSITALRFRQGSHDLFSASADRTLKLFDVSQLSYVETFFGHQEEIGALDILRGEVAVTAGSRDRTARWWKIRDESQLVFRGGGKSKIREVLEGGDIADDEEGRKGRKSKDDLVEGSLDCVAMIDEHTFLSGGDSGTISLWSLSKKKPIFSIPAAHGFHKSTKDIHVPCCITSLACLPYGDVFASGSWDGNIRLWKLSSNLRTFSPLFEIPASGFVNYLQLTLPGRGVLRRLGHSPVEPSQWSRHGGLRGGPKVTFSDSGSDVDSSSSSSYNSQQSEEQISQDKSSAQGQTLLLVAALGQEPVRGRWLRIREARNGALIVPLVLASSAA